MELIVGSAAVRRGDLTRHRLARDYRAVYRDVYLLRSTELTASLRARAAWLATGATLCGLSAAAVHGARWLDPSRPAEIVRADRHSVRGIVAHSWRLADDEICRIDGMGVTTPARTAFDIGRTTLHPVPVMDALLNATGIASAEVRAIANRYRCARGVARLHTLLHLVDGGAESPQESRLRLLLVDGGLPAPETQIAFPELHIRIDMGWRQWKVAVEYDGVQHWSDARQRAWDIERLALLEAAGWAVVRVSAAMMGRPDVVVERVRMKLRAAGCPV